MCLSPLGFISLKKHSVVTVQIVEFSWQLTKLQKKKKKKKKKLFIALGQAGNKHNRRIRNMTLLHSQKELPNQNVLLYLKHICYNWNPQLLPRTLLFSSRMDTWRVKKKLLSNLLHKSDHTIQSLLCSIWAVLLLDISDDCPGTLRSKFLLSTNFSLCRKSCQEKCSISNNAQQFMPHFYIFPHDGKRGQSLTQPDNGSAGNAECHCTNRKPTLALGMRGWYLQIHFILYTMAPSCPLTPKYCGWRHHFHNFNSTTEVTRQVLSENGVCVGGCCQ